MSAERIPLDRAHDVAYGLRLLLEPYCERIEIAGSIRRRRETVKDIELVAVPRMETVAGMDLWGTPTETDRLMEKLVDLSADGLLTPRPVIVHRADGTTETQRRVGQSYQALECRGIPVDLFIVRPPADWGVIFAIRTGPGDFNERIVTDCKRWFRRVEGGRVLHLGQHVPCPEEEDFFRAVGMDWIPPWERTVDKVDLWNPSEPRQ